MTQDPSELLAHTGEIRRLARHLIGDATLADDLTQDTLLAALQGRPAEGVPTYRWLAAVVRNLARQQRRSDARRREREAAAGALPGGSGQGALERLEAHRAVVDAVASLHEPYRSVVVLRYFDGLAPRAIAAREGVPVRTVHTRLHRALGLLRARLGRTGGHAPGAWLPLLLLPPAGASGGLLGTTGVALMMNAKTKLAAGALMLAGLVSVGVSVLRSAEPDVVAALDAPAPVVLEPPEQPAPAPAPAAPPLREQRRAEVALEPEPVPPEPAPAEVLAALRGRVIDLLGTPVAGVKVVHEHRGGRLSEVIHSAPDGTFEFAVKAPEGTVRPADELWTAVLEPVLWDTAPWGGPDEAGRNVLVVAPALSITGEVVDESGAPLPGAELEVNAPTHVRMRLPIVLDGSTARSFFATADEAGHFELDAAAIPGAMIRTWRPGHEDDLRALPDRSTFDLRIVLGNSGDRRTHLRGRVVDATGLGIEDARVALAFTHTRTTAGGGFVLAVNERDEAGTLSALKAGQLPAAIERSGESNAAPGAWPDPPP